jgi:hypothetical protein
MKTIFYFLLMSLVANAGEAATNENAAPVVQLTGCPSGYKETPTYHWDKVKRRWVYVGQTCYPSSGY